VTGDSGTRDFTRPESATLRPLVDVGLGDEVAWSLVDAAPDGMVLADESGQILLVNRQTEAQFGYDRGELLGRPVDDLLPERSRQVHRAHRTRYRVEPRVRPMGAGLELFGRRKDGSEFPVEISLSPITVDGRLMVVAAVRDISERVAEEARGEQIRRLLDATRDGIYIFDGDSLRFTYVNEGAIEQVGYDREALLGMTPLHIAPRFTESEFRALLAPLVEGGSDSTQYLTVHRRRDGDDVPVEVLLQVGGPDPERAHSFVAIVRDVRERRQAEERLREAEQEVRTLEDHERIARDLHDIVIQQLFASGMTLQGVWSRIKEPDAAQRVAAVVDDLDRTIREIRSVIFGLQSFRGDEDGQRAEIARIALEAAANLSSAPRVRFEGAIETIAPGLMEQLLATLREALSNVARHARASSVEVTVDARDGVVLVVTDDGVGIGEGSRTGGRGLRNMADRAIRLGGRFEVRRGADAGTVLEWTVPRSPATVDEPRPE
jgi:PAS domain S-box-containing protein